MKKLDTSNLCQWDANTWIQLRLGSKSINHIGMAVDIRFLLLGEVHRRIFLQGEEINQKMLVQHPEETKVSVSSSSSEISLQIGMATRWHKSQWATLSCRDPVAVCKRPGCKNKRMRMYEAPVATVRQCKQLALWLCERKKCSLGLFSSRFV